MHSAEQILNQTMVRMFTVADAFQPISKEENQSAIIVSRIIVKPFLQISHRPDCFENRMVKHG
jgi:hypothetical protein